jgi:hypothetical protein
VVCSFIFRKFRFLV